MTNRFATPFAFKQSLEQRLKSATDTGADLARRRQLVVFDRFLARVTAVCGDDVTLKGGLALELRLARARTTKDVDLRMMGAPDVILDHLQTAGRLDLGDFMTFDVLPDRHHPDIKGDGMRYDGYRFRAECRIAGKVYGRPFGVDVAFGDPMVHEPELIIAEDVLDFADVPPPTLRIYPVISHIAEKLHAFTLPRNRPNSRVKDLPDIALLATTGPIVGEELRNALERTFEFRATHDLPTTVPSPPSFWEQPYTRMATEDELPWANLADVETAVLAFLGPPLASVKCGRWSPDHWVWET